MIIWVTINIASALLVAMIVAYKLVAYPDRFNWAEKLGMAWIGASMFLRIAPILTNNKILKGPSPFDDWSVSLLHLGCAIYFIGRLYRHEWANWAAIRAAKKHLRERGLM